MRNFCVWFGCQHHNHDLKDPISSGVFCDRTGRMRHHSRSAVAEDTWADPLGLRVADDDLPMVGQLVTLTVMQTPTAEATYWQQMEKELQASDG